MSGGYVCRADGRTDGNGVYRSSCASPGNVAVLGFMNPVCGVILSAVLLGETDSLSVMPVAALVLVCMGIYIVNRPKKAE